MTLNLELSNVTDVATLDTDSATLVFINEPDLEWVGGGEMSNGF